MTDSKRKEIRKIQSILLSIREGSPKFFNITAYEKSGLVFSKKKYGRDAVGNKVEIGHTFHLTEKAKMYLNVIV